MFDMHPVKIEIKNWPEMKSSKLYIFIKYIISTHRKKKPLSCFSMKLFFYDVD